MCGIAGFISLNGILEHRILTTMSAALQHRGPDGYGYLLYSLSGTMHTWHNQEIDETVSVPSVVGFAHRRLSIIDLSVDSLQPMVDDGGLIAVVYNGEIYNYLELRSELEALGHRFRTAGDTEVLMKAYLTWGADCVERFNGMWAFVLLDAAKRRVLFSRDRFGIKPLYYGVYRETLYFASEIKGLIDTGRIPCHPNEKIVGNYLLRGRVDDSHETFFENIYSFPAAHWAEIRLDGRASLEMRPQSYWAFPDERFAGTREEATGRFKSLFADAVRIHCRSDVPVGTCLSGGLDSSSIVCMSEMLRRTHQIPRYTHSAFGYCSADGRFSEKGFMQAVAEATGVRMHYVETSSADFEHYLPHIVKAQDEPFGSASIAAQWFVFQSARQAGMTVMLDGQGADETMGGYHYYYNTVVADLLRKMHITGLLTLRAACKRQLGSLPISIGSVIGHLAPRSMHRISLAAHQIIFSHALFNPISKLLRPEMLQRYGKHTQAFRPPVTLTQRLQREIQSSSLPALLRYEDRNSMAHSIESRVPFLDYRLVNFVCMLPDEWKIHEARTKEILRESMRRILPEVIRNRTDKIGFKAAANLTFEFARQHFPELSKNRTEYEKSWFKPHGFEELMNQSDLSFEAESRLWRVMNSKLWLRRFWV